MDSAIPVHGIIIIIIIFIITIIIISSSSSSSSSSSIMVVVMVIEVEILVNIVAFRHVKGTWLTYPLRDGMQ